MIRHGILLAMVLAIFAGVRSFAPGDVVGTGAALALGALLLGGLQAGFLARALGLPSLTGYIVFGIVAGPDVAGLVTSNMLKDLGMAKRIAVGLIGILAGLEVDLREIRPRVGELVRTMLSGIGTAGVFLFVVAFAIASVVWPTADDSALERALVALVVATAAVAVSPPVVMSVLTEARARGPQTDAWIAVAVLADLAIVIGFAVVGTVVGRWFPTPGESTGVLVAASHLVSSIALGAIIGATLHVYVARGAQRVGLLVFAVLVVVAEAFAPFHIDPLLVGLSAGVALQALRADVATIAAEVQPAALPTFAVFFAVVGAGIDLQQFVRIAPAALLLAIVRGAGFFTGTNVVGGWAGLPADTRRLAPWGMLPQAGIALALADAVSRTFKPWGEVYGTMLVGVVVTNELLGPVLFRRAVLGTAEAGRRAISTLEGAAHVPEATPEPVTPRS